MNYLFSRYENACYNHQNFPFGGHIQSRENKKGRTKIKNCRDDSNMVKQVIYMLVTVVVLFAICWTPLLIDNILTAYGVLSQERSGIFKYMLTTFHLMAYFNRLVYLKKY